MSAVELLQRDTAEQFVTIAYRPERDVRRPESLDVERVDTLGRRVIRHALQVLAQQCDDVRLVQAAFGDIHSCAISSVVKR